MIDRAKCIEHCIKETAKYKLFLEEHKGDRKYANLIPAWEENADMYSSITAYLTEGNI